MHPHSPAVTAFICAFVTSFVAIRFTTRAYLPCWLGSCGYADSRPIKVTLRHYSPIIVAHPESVSAVAGSDVVLSCEGTTSNCSTRTHVPTCSQCRAFQNAYAGTESAPFLSACVLQLEACRTHSTSGTRTVWTSRTPRGPLYLCRPSAETAAARTCALSGTVRAPSTRCLQCCQCCPASPLSTRNLGHWLSSTDGKRGFWSKVRTTGALRD